MTAEYGEWIAIEDEAEPTASGARIDTGEAALAVRQRYRGQSGVEQAFGPRAFSLLQASQHALTGVSDAGVATSEEIPVNRKSTTARRIRLTIFVLPILCIQRIIHQ